MIYRLTTYSPKGFYLAFGSGTPFRVNRWGRETCSAQWRRNVDVCVRCFWWVLLGERVGDGVGGEACRRQKCSHPSSEMAIGVDCAGRDDAGEPSAPIRGVFGEDVACKLGANPISYVQNE